MTATGIQTYDACLAIEGSRRAADRLFFAAEAGCPDSIATINAELAKSGLRMSEAA